MAHGLNVPNEILEKILLNLSYDEIARARLVCKRFDYVCRQLLNNGLLIVQRIHSQRKRALQTLLPKRLSERISHPLYEHHEILSAMELSLHNLSFTFKKYVCLNLCCFYPGKFLDEALLLLRLLRYRVLPGIQNKHELSDLSSMAIEHFDEKIAPELRRSSCFTSACCAQGCGENSAGKPFYCQQKAYLKIKKIESREQTNMRDFKALKAEGKQQKQQINVQSEEINSLKNIISNQQQELKDLKYSFGQLQLKFHDAVTEMKRIRDENAKIAATQVAGLNCSTSLQDPSQRNCSPIVSDVLPVHARDARDRNMNNQENDNESCEKREVVEVKRENSVSSSSSSTSIGFEANHFHQAEGNLCKTARFELNSQNLRDSLSDEIEVPAEIHSIKMETSPVVSAPVSDLSCPSSSQKSLWENIDDNEGPFQEENTERNKCMTEDSVRKEASSKSVARSEVLHGKRNGCYKAVGKKFNNSCSSRKRVSSEGGDPSGEEIRFRTRSKTFAACSGNVSMTLPTFLRPKISLTRVDTSMKESVSGEGGFSHKNNKTMEEQNHSLTLTRRDEMSACSGNVSVILSTFLHPKICLTRVDTSMKESVSGERGFSHKNNKTMKGQNHSLTLSRRDKMCLRSSSKKM